MKKIIGSFIVITMFTLNGCSFLEEANNSINYATEATAYINDLSNFAEETPSLEGAELESRLESLQVTIEDFMEIEPPSIAEGIHEDLENKSQVLLDATNNVIDNGEVAIKELKESEIYTTIENITNLMNQIEDLGL